MASEIGTAAISAGGGIIGSTISAIANSVENRKAFERQQFLNRQRYTDFLNFSRRAGATPAAIAQGITGSGAGAVPSTSTGGNPVPDLGQSFTSGISAAANMRNAAAAETTANSEAEINRMKLIFEPKKYFADCARSLSEAFKNHKEGMMFGSMKQHYDELVTDLQRMRPWKIAGLRVGLMKDLATYKQILQDTKTSKALQGKYEAEEGKLQAEEGYYKAGTYELGTRASLNLANADKAYSESLILGLQNWRLQFETSLLSAGIDVNKPFWENTFRLASTNPRLFEARMNTFITSLGFLDNRIQQNLGEHYKRNIALGVGLNWLNGQIGKHRSESAKRLNLLGRTISSFIPFAGGSGETIVTDPSKFGVDWWNKD